VNAEDSSTPTVRFAFDSEAVVRAEAGMINVLLYGNMDRSHRNTAWFERDGRWPRSCCLRLFSSADSFSEINAKLHTLQPASNLNCHNQH